MKSKEYVDEYQTIRIVAIILVVIGHVSTLSVTKYDASLEYSFDGLYVSRIFEYIRVLIYSFHMPLFVALSGAVFAYTYTKQKGYIVKRAKKLLTPYVICSLFLLFPSRIISGYYEGIKLSWSLMIHDYLLGFDVNYLWYILALFEINVAVVFLSNYFLSDSRKTNIGLYVFLLLVSAGQFLILNNDKIPFQIGASIRYVFWFYIGIIIEKNRIKIKAFSLNKKYLIILFGLWITGVGTHNYLEFYISTYSGLSLLLWIVKMVKMIIRYFLMEGAGVLFFTCACFRMGKIDNKILRYIGKRSFQIYLYNCPVIYILKVIAKENINYDSITNISYILLMVVMMVFAICGSLFFDWIVLKLCTLHFKKLHIL